MQNYVDLAKKNGITLLDEEKCQFCGANTKRGIHECLEIFNLGFQDIDFSSTENHIYRFLIVDAHTLQHPEIHGRWNNHFHLSRLHLIFRYKVEWNYNLSPLLSEWLNRYKVQRKNEYLIPPEVQKRGTITTTDILRKIGNPSEVKKLIESWVKEVYGLWDKHHPVVDEIAKMFLNPK